MSSKKREKRTRSQANESNSFVKKVTSRMSALLPASIAKWFGSTTSSANGSVQAADGSDSSTEDEGPDSQAYMEPRSKRMRYSAPVNQFTPSEVTPSSPIKKVATQNYRESYDQQPQAGQAPLQNDTPPFSSTRIHPEENVISNSSREVIIETHRATNSTPPVPVKRKSIFESTGVVTANVVGKPCENSSVTEKKIPAVINVSSRPSIKSTYFGSPFYPGRTMYGGASSSSLIIQNNLNRTKVANVKQSQQDYEAVNMSNKSRQILDFLENYSSPLKEAQRISRIMNSSYNSSDSPANTSKHGYSYKTQELYIPSKVSLLRRKQRYQMMETTKAAYQIFASHSSTLSSNFDSYYDGEKPTASPVKMNTNKESTNKIKTNITRPIRGETSSEMPELVQLPTAVLQIDKDNLPKFSLSRLPTPVTTKCLVSTSEQANTSRLSSVMSVTPATSTFGLSSVISLASPAITPTATFSSIGTPNRHTNKIQVPMPILPIVHVTNNDVNESDKLNEHFTFSNPIPIGNEAVKPQRSSSSTNLLFSFDVPQLRLSVEKSKEHKSDTAKSETLHLPIEKPNKNTVSTPKPINEWKCSECWVYNKSDVSKCACCGAKPPTQGDTPMEPVDEWKCNECWINNKSVADKCACCEAKRPTKEAMPLKPKCIICKLAKSQPDTDKCANCEKIQLNKSIALPLPLPADPTKWKCEGCWVSNDGSADKCACCASAKPKKLAVAAAKPANVNSEKGEKSTENEGVKGADKAIIQPLYRPVSKSDDVTMSDVHEEQKDNWECMSCLVRNLNDKSNCTCCETERPGLTKNITTLSARQPVFNLGTTNTTFKFGIDANQQKRNLQTEEEVSPKKQRTAKKEPTRILEEPETNNNTVRNLLFSFSKVDDNSDSAKVVKAPKMTFNFGIPKLNTEPALNLGNESPTLIPQIVHSVDFNAPEKPALPFAGYFAPPATAQQAPNTFGTFTAPVALSDEKKEPATFGFGAPNVSTMTSQPPPISFAFDSDAMTGNSNQSISSVHLFGNQEANTVSSSSMSFGMPQTVQTAATAMPSIFQEPLLVTAPGLFQTPNEPTPSTFFNATSKPAPTVSPSLFSFGSNTQTQAVEKSKFNFSFGGSTQTPNGGDAFNQFKSVFGQSNTTSAPGPFGNLSGNSLTPGSQIVDNSMSGGNNMANSMGGLNQIVDSGMQASGGLFGAPAQTESIWGASNMNTANAFGSTAQKPAPFTFGSPNQFNPAQAQSQALFSPQNQQAFNQAQPSSNVFGSGAMFSNSVPQNNVFGNSQPPQLFGANNNQSTIPGFEPVMPHQPQPQPQPLPQNTGFNFVFGFGNQSQGQQSSSPQRMQSAQPGVYNFGGSGASMASNPMGGVPMGSSSMGSAPMGGVQFNMGSAPPTSVRRMRKALRRNPQR